MARSQLWTEQMHRSIAVCAMEQVGVAEAAGDLGQSGSLGATARGALREEGQSATQNPAGELSRPWTGDCYTS